MKVCSGAPIAEPVPYRLVSANFENASRIRALWLRSYFRTRRARLELSTLSMLSGAGHDAQSIALLAPVGMIFVPSVNGISHSSEEFTEPKDVANGTAVLLEAIFAADSRYSQPAAA